MSSPASCIIFHPLISPWFWPVFNSLILSSIAPRLPVSTSFYFLILVASPSQFCNFYVTLYILRLPFKIFKLNFYLLELGNHSCFIGPFWWLQYLKTLCFCCLLVLLVFHKCSLVSSCHLWMCAEHGISIIVSRNHFSVACQFSFAFPSLLWVIAIWDYLNLNLEFEIFWVM